MHLLDPAKVVVVGSCSGRGLEEGLFSTSQESVARDKFLMKHGKLL